MGVHQEHGFVNVHLGETLERCLLWRHACLRELLAYGRLLFEELPAYGGVQQKKALLRRGVDVGEVST